MKAPVLFSCIGLSLAWLSFAFNGAHGIRGGEVRDFTVRNCSFSWIGGSFLSDPGARNPRGVRYGNGIEIWAVGPMDYIVASPSPAPRVAFSAAQMV